MGHSYSSIRHAVICECAERRAKEKEPKIFECNSSIWLNCSSATHTIQSTAAINLRQIHRTLIQAKSRAELWISSLPPTCIHKFQMNMVVRVRLRSVPDARTSNFHYLFFFSEWNSLHLIQNFQEDIILNTYCICTSDELHKNIHSERRMEIFSSETLSHIYFVCTVWSETRGYISICAKSVCPPVEIDIAEEVTLIHSYA